MYGNKWIETIAPKTIMLQWTWQNISFYERNENYKAVHHESYTSSLLLKNPQLILCQFLLLSALFQMLYKVNQSKYHSCTWSLHTFSWLAKQAISPNLSRSTLNSIWIGKTEIKTKDLGSLWMAIVLHYHISIQGTS